ncbi:MAG TPA: hypothetical protein VF600_07445 [Abditibacteriaceae bacterium]
MKQLRYLLARLDANVDPPQDYSTPGHEIDSTSTSRALTSRRGINKGARQQTRGQSDAAS